MSRLRLDQLVSSIYDDEGVSSLSEVKSIDHERWFVSGIYQHFDTPVTFGPPKPYRVIGAPIVQDLRVLDVLCHAEVLLNEENYKDAFEAHKFAMSATEQWAVDAAEEKAIALDDSVNSALGKLFPASAQYVYAEVDVQAPLDQLISSFTAWVREVKQRQNQKFAGKRAFGNSDFAKWDHYRILPYFDLKLWSKINNIRFPEWYYVDLLFKDRDGDVASFFRQTCKPTADRVLTWECSESLRLQGGVFW